MGYDSIKTKVNDYSRKKADIDKEDSILSRDEQQLYDVIRSSLSLDKELQEKINSAQNEYAAERSRIESEKNELSKEKTEISNEISEELGKLETAEKTLSRIETMKYGKTADKAKKKSNDLKNQLRGMLDELNGRHSYETIGDSSGAVTFDSHMDSISAASTDNSPVWTYRPGKAPFGEEGFKSPLVTSQTTETVTLDGKTVDIFDHPFEPNDYRICNQGSAYPTGPRQTCGCCACGTIINKAGGNINEHDIVEYAWNNQYCGDSGRTTPENWVNILKGSGIDCRETSGVSLEKLADYVERGHGVIIGVCAHRYCPEKFKHGLLADLFHVFPGCNDGHALVLESVIRDHETGKILEYVVSDSKGDSRDAACRRVPAKQLERAFARKNKNSVVTNEIIW